MSDYYELTKWREYQHYKDRNPPWIKLHFDLLTSETWVSLDDAARVLAIACMLIASRNDGRVPKNPVYLQRVAYLNKPPNFKPLLDSGFLTDASAMLADDSNLLADASAMLATSKTFSNHAIPETETEAYTETEAETEGDRACARAAAAEKYECVFADWNATASEAGLPAVAAITPKRRTAARERWREKWWRDNYQAALSKVAASAFCTGTNDRQWKADIDWFLRPDSVARTMEGKYDDRTAPRPEGWRESDEDIF